MGIQGWARLISQAQRLWLSSGLGPAGKCLVWGLGSGGPQGNILGYSWEGGGPRFELGVLLPPGD